LRFDEVATALNTISNWSVFASDLAAEVDRWPPQLAAAFVLEAAAACQRADHQEVPLRKPPRDRLLLLGAAMASEAHVSRSFELVWLSAAAALAQGTGGEYPAKDLSVPLFGDPPIIPIFDRAQRRFPESRELELSRALIRARGIHAFFAEGWFTPEGFAMLSRTMGHIRDELGAARVSFERLLGNPAIADEVNLQLGFIAMLERRFEEALRRLSTVETSSADADRRYIARLLQARVLIDADRRSQTVEVLRRALQEQPAADSAARLLASLLYLGGDRETARQLVQVSIDTIPARDPWAYFPFGEFRFWPARLQELRDLLR
jgi:tetratricopeptide (TPR) repeat protein